VVQTKTFLDLERASADADSRYSKVEALVRELAGEIVELESAVTDDGNATLLDIELDGIRCTFVRIRPIQHPSIASLSPREKEIVRMVAKGHTNKAIAAVLDISTWTVSTHLRRVFAKLAVTSRAAMVARTIEDGLIADLHQPTGSSHPTTGA
jgi:DNA-binding CsgD family transcriptional regulator